MIKSILLLSALLASTCQVGPFPKPTPQPEPPTPIYDDAAPPPPVPDAGSGIVASCTAACARFAQLGCKQAQPTPGGATCVEVCVNVETSGVITLGPDCVVHAARCEDADACAYSIRRSP